MQSVPRIAAAASAAAAVAVLAASRPAGAETVPPTVAIDSPANGATVTGVLTIVVAAADETAMESVALTIDGISAGPADTMAPYQFEWNATAAGPGMHTLLATARDTSANTATATVTVTVPSPSPEPEPEPEPEPPAEPNDELPSCSLDAGGGGAGLATIAAGLALVLRRRGRGGRGRARR
jgi:Bacterial Ig domain